MKTKAAMYYLKRQRTQRSANHPSFAHPQTRKKIGNFNATNQPIIIEDVFGG